MSRPASAVAIGQIRRNEQLPLRSHRHQLQRLGPALDDSAHRERDRLTAFLELSNSLPLISVPLIVAGDRVGRRRLRPCSRCQNLVLQAAGQRDHAFFGLVRGQKRIAFFPVSMPAVCAAACASPLGLLLRADIVLAIASAPLSSRRRSAAAWRRSWRPSGRAHTRAASTGTPCRCSPIPMLMPTA